MRSITVGLLFCALALLVSCSQAVQPRPEEPRSRPSAPAIPLEVTSAAQTILGAEAEVLAFGDLARTGQQQALVVNRLAKTPTGAAPGMLVTRAVIVESNGGKWREVFRCDEHLKNPSGFLGATPVSPVTGWRLQYEQDPGKGLQMYFAPLEQPAGGHIPAIGVRWNPKVKRYQSLDRSFEHFLGEVPSLERIGSYLR